MILPGCLLKGLHPTAESGKIMRAALSILDSKNLDFSYEGEMHSDSALDEDLRKRIFRESRFSGAANVLVFSNIDAASGVRNILKMDHDINFSVNLKERPKATPPFTCATYNLI